MLHSFIKNGKERKDRCVFFKRMDAQPCSWLHIHVSLESSCFGIGHQLGISVSWHHCVKFASNSFWANNVSATTFTNVSFSCGAVQNSFLRVSVFFSFIIQCTHLIGRKKGLYFHDWAPPSSSCSNSWGWLHGRCGQTAAVTTVLLGFGRGWCSAMVSSRQSKSISKAAVSRKSSQVLGLGVASDQLCLKLARLLRSPRAFCRNVCGQEAGEDWRFGSPPLGSSSCPPPRALLCLLIALSLLRSTPHPHTLIMTMPRALTLSPCAHPYLTMGWPFLTFLLSLTFCSCRFSYQLPCLSVNKALFPPTSQLGLYTN